MKKLLTGLAVLMLLLAGLFFWKGGHHALFLADAMEDWLDDDESDQSLTFQLQSPGFSEDMKPEVRQLSLTADSFWTEYADQRFFGLSAGSATAYIQGGNLYLDTGKVYALPDVSGLYDRAKDLALGLLLHGRITKTDNVYHIDMISEDLEFSCSVTVDRGIRSLSVQAVVPEGESCHIQVIRKQTVPHAIPQPVLDATVLARMEKPRSILEPLEALKQLLPQLEDLRADAVFSVDCGILEVEGSGKVTLEEGKLFLSNDLGTVELKSLDNLTDLSPAAAGLMLLRNADYLTSEFGAEFRIQIPAQELSSFAETMVPEFQHLPVSWKDCQMTLRIPDNGPATIHLQTEGTVPLVLAEIPLTFTAEFILN